MRLGRGSHHDGVGESAEESDASTSWARVLSEPGNFRVYSSKPFTLMTRLAVVNKTDCGGASSLPDSVFCNVSGAGWLWFT